MTSYERRSPDELLEAVKREESLIKRGRLKIFLGMAAGVGKTYAMLLEAHELKNAGIDVAIGIVDTHGRQDTIQAMEGLKIIPEKLVEYKGTSFKELDLDTILELKPQLVLVDELAHSNIPGLRHAKRWQDIVEILDHGIDVYTTLNVQHIESLNDIIRDITEVSVRETVPDLVIEKASSIQLLDLTPDELLIRLKEGKVYLGEQSKIAAQNFFQKDRLAALREIVLRYAAEKIDRDLRTGIPTSARTIEWKPREKFLTAISPSPLSQKIIRTARRMAATINAPWIAIYVNTDQMLSEEDNKQLALNLQLARDLGAEVMTINDYDISNGIQRIARQRGITRIILGRSPKNFLLNLFKPSLFETLTKHCPDVDIHVIRQESSLKRRRKKLNLLSIHLSPYIIAFISIIILSILNWLIVPYIGYRAVGAIFLLVVLTLSLQFKRGVVFFSAILSGLIWSYYFLPPLKKFSISSPEDSVLLILYAIIAFVTGILTDRTREYKKILIKNEESIRVLYDIVQQFTAAPSTHEIFKFIKDRLRKAFQGSFEIIVKAVDNGLLFDTSSEFVNSPEEKAAAMWVFENGKEAGWSTDTLPSAKNLYLPLRGFNEIVGVLIFRSQDNLPLSPEKKNFLYTVGRQLSSHLERLFSEEKTKQHEQLKQIEMLHKTILDLFSREFEIPIKSIKEGLKHLNTIETFRREETFQNVQKSFLVLEKILNNVLAMAQLSEGMIPLNKTPQNIKEFVEECCQNISSTQNGHKIELEIQDELPLISFDYYLIHMLLYNLILNAMEYSPENSTIEIEAKISNGCLVLSVADEGEGIPEDQLEVIFEKFHRGKSSTPGLGLGLAIAKTTAVIHQGRLIAENLPGKGAKFSLFLPLEN